MTLIMSNIMFKNGFLSTSTDIAAVSTLLQAIPGAYTTTRTQNAGSEFLFLERHLSRLTDSVNILLHLRPEFLFKSAKVLVPFDNLLAKSTIWDSMIRALVKDSMKKSLPAVLEMRECGNELAVTILVSGNSEKLGVVERIDEGTMLEILDVYLHFGDYVPLRFACQGSEARLAVVGQGRNLANAKYSGWVRQRKQLDMLKPPSVNELLLSNDGNHILEGCVTNFFVICRKDDGDSFEIQTAPVSDGVLPGVIRQVIIDICSRKGILLREISPSWRQREFWEEAFVTNGLRLIQHVQSIMAPNLWDFSESKTWKDITWEEKQFKENPGKITSLIKKELMEATMHEAYPIGKF